MSNLIEETEDYLIIDEYLHNNSESYSDWMIDHTTDEPKYPYELLLVADSALYEVKIRYRIDKDTLKVTLLSIDGFYIKGSRDVPTVR